MGETTEGLIGGLWGVRAGSYMGKWGIPTEGVNEVLQGEGVRAGTYMGKWGILQKG